jgi:hypothetical protein
VLLACSAACARPGGNRDVTVNVDVTRPGAVLAEDFLGLSFEASVLGSPRLSPSGSNLPALLRTLGAGHLRFGGNSLDRVAPWVPDAGAPAPPWAAGRVTRDDLRNLGVLTEATGWRVDLGLTLGHPDPAAAAAEASAAAGLIGPRLDAVAIGNEPDAYAADKRLKPQGYTFADYERDVDAYRAAIAAAVSGIHFAGPDTAGLGWLSAYGRDGQRARLSFLTQHDYPLSRCGGPRPTIADLLSSATRQRSVQTIDGAVAAARTAGLPIRLDEVNSASCGGQDGVSNTLASALWMVDYLLLAGERGVAGVDVHGGLAVCGGYSPLCVPGAATAVPASRPGIDPVADDHLGAAAGTGPLAVQPDFYGLLLVRQLEGGRSLPVTSPSGTRVRDFAMLMPDDSIRVVLVNPDASPVRVVIRAGVRRTLSGVLSLTGSSLAATAGVSLGGAGVAADGTWTPVPGVDRRPPSAAETVLVDVGAASAEVVSLSPPSPGQ